MVQRARSHDCRCTRTMPGPAQPCDVMCQDTTLDSGTENTNILSSSGATSSTECGDECSIDLDKYITAKKLKQGKNHFDKNLRFGEVTTEGRPTPLIEQVAAIDKHLDEVGGVICLHVMHERQMFTQQKVQLMLQALTGRHKTMQQLQFVYGPVKNQQPGTTGSPLTTASYYKYRFDQMTQASVMKYGQSVQGEDWESMIRGLTDACIKFELLSSVARNVVKLNIPEPDSQGRCDLGHGSDQGRGSFVMYNCARLSALLSQFHKMTQKGIYPELPPPDRVDCSLLKEEEEWWLVYNYVSIYPVIVAQTVEPFDSSASIQAKIHTHKICNFLSSLSRCVSSYYSRVHVLGENRPYLLPTMFARLYLLKCVHQVMVNALGLLGIDAPTQL